TADTRPARTKRWRHGNVDGRSMPSDAAQIRFLLDEHYPGWLADDLKADGLDVVALTAHRPELRGVDDGRVLQAVGTNREKLTRPRALGLCVRSSIAIKRL